MSDIRMLRVESLIRDEISLLIVNNRIKDPRVSSFLTVNQVKAAKDLSHAKVLVSSFESEKKLAAGVEALNHAAGFIQREVGKKLQTRMTPKLTFVKDNSIKEGFEINKIIDDLNETSENSTGVLNGDDNY